MHAKLRFSYGTMGSGKSLELLTTAYNFETKNIPFAIIKSSVDTRDGGKIMSRIGDGVSRECILINQEINLYDFYIQNLKTKNIQWLFIDEAQFLTEEQIDQLSDIVDYENVDVWCFGLRTDFKTHLFPGAKRLFEIADKIKQIKSACGCGRKNIVNAKFTKDGKLAIGGAQVDIGGDEKYSAICRKCYKEKMKEYEKES